MPWRKQLLHACARATGLGPSDAESPTPAPGAHAIRQLTAWPRTRREALVPCAPHGLPKRRARAPLPVRPPSLRGHPPRLVPPQAQASFRPGRPFRRASVALGLLADVGLVDCRVFVRVVLGGLLEVAHVEVLEVVDGLLEALVEGHLGLPLDEVLRESDVRSPLLGVVVGQGLVDDLGLGARQLDGLLRELLDGEFARVAKVHRANVLILVHKPHNALDEVVHVAEGPRLRAVPVDGDVLAVERLHDEVGHHAAVVRVHARAVGVEDADHAHVHVVLPVVVEAEGLRAPLALVVAGPHARAVHVAPVGLRLGRHVGVAVDL
mmetsp:Transcript_4992/g.16733  ORF Transcript_4992/g.16733 Transcript_4992/m.16733 type:complete len:322 (+) Transcript_4992:2055-3020(+)